MMLLNSIVGPLRAVLSHPRLLAARNAGAPPAVEGSATTSGADRDRLAGDGDRIADLRDTAAAERDRDAGSRDRRSQARAPAGTSVESLAAATDRQQARQDRQHSAGDRARAAEDREHAEADRSASAGDRATSSYDGLTGLYRRDAGIVELEREIARAGRSDDSYVVAYIDVDGLKARNDSQGHAAGDRLLVLVAGTIRAMLRPYDLSVRIGGDEIVCGLPGVGLAEAAERFAGLRIELGAADAPISVGLAQLRPGETLDALLARADTAMYDQRHIAIRDPAVP